MKKPVLFVLTVIIATLANAQPGKPAKPTTITKTPAPILKNMSDSASYAVGISVSNFYKTQGVKKLNTVLISKGCNDIMAGKTPLMNDETANMVMNNYINQLKTEKPKTTTPVTKPIPATKTPAPVLKNMVDSADYAIGISVASFYGRLGVKKINTVLVTKGINDIMGGKTRLMDDETANTVMNNYIMQVQAEKSKITIEAGEKYLAANKSRDGVKVTASGLQYEVITEGTGEKPTAADSVTCHYRGTFIDGKGFDNSYDRGQPITFSLSGVIRGWTEGLQLMSVGSKYKFYVPYTLGYGPSDYMSIPGGSALVFEVELLAVRKKQ